MERNSTHTRLKHAVARLRRLPAALLAVVAAFVVGIVAVVAYMAADNSVSVSKGEQIDITPTTIQSIEDIGQWEFLSVSNEELIDTVRHGFFGDDQLVRIYYGTLRIGVDMHQAKPGWVEARGDSVTVTLPPMTLLDHDFIDEARTRSFFESGKWSHEDKANMYKKAYEAMKKRCLNQKNMDSARQNAVAQFTKIMQSMGFKRVKVRFQDQANE